LTLSEDNRFLFAVNPGSNDVSSFLVTPSGLQFVSKVPSGGVLPVSVTTFGNLVYVVNAVNNLVGTVGLDGVGTGQIAGFTVDLNGVLTPLEDSGRTLSSAVSGPAQVAFNSAGTLPGRRAKSFSQFRGGLRDLGDSVLVGVCCGWRSPGSARLG